MKKTVQTGMQRCWATWMLTLLAFLALGSVTANELAAQASQNYIITATIDDITWDYQDADCDLGLSTCFLILTDEGAGDFGFIVNGYSFILPEDFNVANAGSYVTDYNLGQPLNIAMISQTVAIGDPVPTSLPFFFEAHENDCGEVLQSNNTGLCLVNGDDEDVNTIDNFDLTAAGLGAVAGGDLVPGTYTETFTYTGTDGGTYTLEATVTVLGVPAGCPGTFDIFGPDGLGYECLDEFTATTSIDYGGFGTSGGTPGATPIKVYGSGIYNPINGAPFDFGIAPFGLEFNTGAGTFDFLVHEDQPWQIILVDANGCMVAAEGVYDQPDPQISSDFSSVCLNGPIFELYDEAIFYNPTAPAGDWFVDLDVSLPGSDQIIAQDTQFFTFDPNDLGPGQHKISYCLEDNYGCDFYVCDDQVINIFPAFYPDEVGFILEPTYTTCQVPTGGTPGVALNLGGDDNNDPLDGDYLTNAEVAAIFAGVEDAFDPDGDINEMDYFVVWQGPGVHDIGAAGNYFDPAEAGPGVHNICVTVGYPDCNQTYCRAVSVVIGFDPAVALNPSFLVCENAQGHATLSGANEVPANASAGIGDVFYTFDDSNNTLTLNITYSGMNAAATAAHVHVGAPGATGAPISTVNLTPPTSAQGTFTGSAVLSDANAAAFLAGNLYLNIHSTAFATGELRAQLSGFTGSLACSTDDGCPITVNAAAAAELLSFNSGASGHSGNVAPSGTTTATGTITIPQVDQATLYAIVTNLTIQYNYLAATNDPAADGDYDQITIVGPGGVTIHTEGNPGGGGLNDHFPFRTITFEQVLAAYDASTPGVAGDGLEVLANALRCSNPAFSYTLISNSDNYQINIDVNLSYTNRYGQFQASINAPGGNVLPPEAITFDETTGQYTFNTRFTTADGEYYDLGAYDEIEICFLNAGNCATLIGAGGAAQCASQHCMVVQVVSGGNANINNEPLCLSSFDALHLPTAFFIDGVTTPGGIWTIADANSPDGASNTAGTGVFGEFFNPWMVPAGTYNVCYSLFEAEANPLIDCGQPIQGADCATIIVPVHYCIEFAENVVCENCDEDGLLPIIVGSLNAAGDCVPLGEDINIGGDVYETFTACRADYDNNNSNGDDDVDTGNNDVQNQRPTTLDAWDAYGQANSNAAWQICNDNLGTAEKQEGLYTVIENTFTLPAGAQVDDIIFRYNYISTTGTAQGDHDGWGVYFNSFPACVGASTYPTNVLSDAAGDPIGYADNQDPDGDNHFPDAFPSTAFEVRDASSAHITAVQNAINTLPADECSIEFTYYYIVASNSQYWDACFNVDVAYHFNPGEEPQTNITAVFHEPLEDGNVVPVYPAWTPTNPIVIQTNDDGSESYFLNTCNLGGLDEISLILDIEAALDDDCDGIQTGGCFPTVHSDALVVLESDGFTCGFTTNVSPSVCSGEQITITPSGTITDLDFVFQNGVAHAITDEDAAVPGIQWTIPAEDAGLYHINMTSTSPNGCICSHSETVLVAAQPVAAITAGANFVVCNSALPIDLTQYVGGSSELGGIFTASAGDIVSGQLLMTVAGGSVDVTYTIGSEVSDCEASVTFTITTTTQAIAIVNAINQQCEGATLNLNNFLSASSTPGGTWTDNGVVIADPTAWTPTAGAHDLLYSVGTGDCAAADGQIVYVNNEFTAQAEYGFVCQSETDFVIDLTDYLADGAAVMNGGTFSIGNLPPFISEIEYVGGPQISGRDWIEVTGVAGTDLSDYALVFYKRGGYTDDQVWNDDASSGHVYGWINLSGTIDNEVTASSGVSYGSAHFEYNDATNDVDCHGNTIVETPAIAGIAEGPAGVALVWVGDQTCEELDNNDVIQFIGYGVRPDNTNAGIFSACNGPAATLVTTDINVIDMNVPAAGLNYDGNLFGGDAGVDITSQFAVQFTNGCWVVPSVTDPAVAYATTGPGIADADLDGNGDLSTAGQLNLGLVGDTNAEGNDFGHGGADELYFDYVAPNGDVMHLDRICHVLFMGGQIVDTAPWVNQENQEAGNGFQDDDVVRFECQTQTYTIPFTYQVLGNGVTTCQSDAAVFNLTVLMDYEENWNGSAPGSADPAVHQAGDHGYEVLKEGVCDYSETNLNQYIDDVVHFITPIHSEGSFDTIAEFTFEENVKNPDFTELHYSHYGYTGTAADDHCVIYNYIDDNNTPFNDDDDTFQNWNFCEGIEISAEVGSELSCYGLVFYTNDSPNGRGLATDVTYIGVDGMPHTTDVANGIYMQLYGRVDEDPVDWSLPNGSVLSVPVDNGEADAWGNLPWYGGFNPVTGTNGNGPTAADDGSVDNPVRHSGLYIDVNSNERYDAADIPVPSAVAGTPSDGANFPWERGNECPKPDAGSRWFPILDVPGGPGEVAGVGLVNQCNGELVKYISWGGTICNEDKEGFTLAGPFEQLTSSPIDTTQNVGGTLGDQRTLQLVSCSQLPACPAGAEQVWVLSYNGGAFTIPGTNGAEVQGSEELYEFSNSIGYYNCNMAVEDVVAQPESFTLDLSDLSEASVPDHFVLTGHTIEVTIGSVDDNYSQLYTYHIGVGACQIPNNATDLAEYTNTNIANVIPGQYCGGDFDGDHTNVNPAMDVDINPTDGIYDFLTHPFSPFATNDAWAAGNMPSPVYMGSTVDGYGYPAENGSNDTDSHCLGCTTDPNYCHDDLEFAPDQPNWTWTDFSGPRVNSNQLSQGNNAAVNGELSFEFDNGEGELNPNGSCFVGQCSDLIKTTYTVSDLRALLYNGNIIPGYEDGEGDTCRSVTPDIDEVRVTIRVSATYEQCIPAGHFAGTDVSLNQDNIEQPYWVFAPDGLADISPIAITYDVTNAHEIEVDDANDDLACLDDDNDNIRTQFIDVLGAGSATLSAAAITVCSADLPIDLDDYVTGGSGTWSGTGVGSNGNFNGSSTTATLTVGGGTCQDQATLAITVEQSASVNVSGLPSTVCAGTVVTLPAASWTASAGTISGNSWTAPAAGGAATLSYTAGGANCGDAGTVTIDVDTPLSVTENFDADACSVTLTISGGNGAGTYTANGQAVAGNSQTFSVDGNPSLTVIVGSAGSACGTFTFNGGPYTCTPNCTANAFGLTVSGGGELCGNGTLLASASFGEGNSTRYVLVDADGNVVNTSSDGSFDFVNAAGIYTIYAIGYCEALITPANTLAGLQNQQNGTTLDLDGPVTVTISPAITIELTTVCVEGEGWTVQAVVSGGDVEVNGSGSYNSSCPVTILNDGNGGTGPIVSSGATYQIEGTFAPGSTVVCSFGDGSLCEASASITIPNEPCGLSAGADNGNTLVDQSIVINVLSNDLGNGLQITGYNQPEHGTVTLDANGNFVYTPNEGYVGTDAFTYEVTDVVGQTGATTVFVTVSGSGALIAVDTRDCSDAAVTGFSVVTVAVSGGTAPYTFGGSYTGTLATTGSVQFDVSEGSGYYVEVTDATNTTFVIDESDALPCTKVSVELLAYDGEVKTEGNLLRWVTASEIDNNYFILEYSTNGTDFEQIATVTGNGTTSSAHSYDYMHKDAQSGIGYYRLSTVDGNSNVVIEGVVTLVRGELGFTFVNVRPVPATTVLNVEFNNTVTGNVSVEVYNTVGQLVSRQTVVANNGINTASVDVTNFANGTYFLTINNGQEVRVTKFVKD